MNEPQYVQRDREYQRKYYADRREQKLVAAKLHRILNRDAMNERRRKRRIELGLPVRNGQLLSRKTDSVKDYNNLYHTERRAVDLLRIKILALQKVSGQRRPVCCKCGCDDLRVLAINHINGDGRKDRLGEKIIKSIRKAIVLGKRKVDDLDVRCYNCNTLYEYERGRWRLPRDWKQFADQMMSD